MNYYNLRVIYYITQLIELMKMKLLSTTLIIISKFQLLNSSFHLVGTFNSIMSCLLAAKTNDF